MESRERTLQTGTALLVVGRLLLEPPGQRTWEMFSSPQFLASWPLGPGAVTEALGRIGGIDQESAAAEFRHLTAPGSGVDMVESTRLATPTARKVWEDLLRECATPQAHLHSTAPADHLGRELTWLAEETIALATRAGADTGAASADLPVLRMAGVRARHVRPLARAVAGDLREKARTQPYVVLPLLLEESVEAHAQLFPAPEQDPQEA